MHILKAYPWVGSEFIHFICYHGNESWQLRLREHFEAYRPTSIASYCAFFSPVRYIRDTANFIQFHVINKSYFLTCYRNVYKVWQFSEKFSTSMSMCMFRRLYLQVLQNGLLFNDCFDTNYGRTVISP